MKQRLRGDWPVMSLSALSVASLVLLGVVIFHTPTYRFVGPLLGLCEKADVLRFLGFGLGGLLVALQAAVSYKRAKALEDAAQAQAAGAQAQATAAIAQTEANTYVEYGQRQQRLKDAIEHLGHESVSIRLGGAYELVALAQDTENLRPRVARILCAHVCVLTTTIDYQRAHGSTPSVEVQSLLSLLFEGEGNEKSVFQGQNLDLTGSWLNGAHLTSAYMLGAVLDGVSLQEAQLDMAQLPAVCLSRADLRGASLAYADLPIAQLMGAQLQGANLVRANLQAADLTRAELQGAYLKEVHLQEAHFEQTALHGVQGGGDDVFDPEAGFQDRIRSRIGRCTDVSEVVFNGGLTKKKVEDLGAISELHGLHLMPRLEHHIGKPGSSRPPEGVISGSYTETEATRWLLMGRASTGGWLAAPSSRPSATAAQSPSSAHPLPDAGGGPRPTETS